MMNYKTVTLLILIGLFIVVCIQNVEEIPLHFLLWTTSISKLLLLLITLTIGILVGVLLRQMMKKSKTEEKIKT